MEKTRGHLVHPRGCTRKVAGAKQPVDVMLTRQHFSSWSGAVAHTHCNEDAEQILFTDLKKYLEALHFHKMIGNEVKESVGVPR